MATHATDAHIFVSHSTRDATLAHAFCQEAEARRSRCWIAPRDIRGGVPFASEITQAIREARAVVLLLSVASRGSEYVLREIDLAAGQAVPVITVRLEEISPGDALAFYVGKDQWIDALCPPIEPHVEKVLNAVEHAAALRIAMQASTEEDWRPPRERVLKEIAEDLRQYFDHTFRLRAALEEATELLTRRGPATDTLLRATLSYNQFSPPFVDRLGKHRAAVRKYWGEDWLGEFDALQDAIEGGVYRGALFRLNGVRARLNTLLEVPVPDVEACRHLDAEKAPLLADVQGRLDAVAQQARRFLAALERGRL
ncbi:MAG: toll/interleukin-1 receptor domain-containing protein [Planctomycetota bacterium]